MNERIKHLLNESTYDVLGVKQVDQKKFAELIVKECAKVADCRNSFRHSSGNKILKHFGVEG